MVGPDPTPDHAALTGGEAHRVVVPDVMRPLAVGERTIDLLGDLRSKRVLLFLGGSLRLLFVLKYQCPQRLRGARLWTRFGLCSCAAATWV